MKKKYNLHIEKLPEGFFLATSEDVQGLVAQGKTKKEAIEIANDVAKKLLEIQNGIASPSSNFQIIKSSN